MPEGHRGPARRARATEKEPVEANASRRHVTRVPNSTPAASACPVRLSASAACSALPTVVAAPSTAVTTAGLAPFLRRLHAMLPLASAGLPAASALRSSRSSLCPARVLRVRPAPPRWSCSVSCVGRQPPAGAGASRAAHRSLSTAALAVSAERPAAGTEEDSPRDAVAAAEYRKLLDAEEEAGLYEEPDENEERVEVDASALPDDTLAVSRERSCPPGARCSARKPRPPMALPPPRRLHSRPAPAPTALRV